MTAREQMMTRIRAALGREPGDRVAAPPPVRLSESPRADLVAQFREALEALGGSVVEGDESVVERMTAGKKVVRSTEPFSREACAQAEIGVTRPDYALADTGTLIFITGSRLISLLPPRHIAVIERAKILASLDQLLGVVPQPAEQSSAMTLVTGPSRTADIEMRLVRGVHGPGEITVIVVA